MKSVNQQLLLDGRPTIIASILLSAMLGCASEDSSLTDSVSCAAPVINPSGPMLGLVTPSIDTAGNGPLLTLRWDASSSADGYSLYIGTTSQSYQQVADVGLITTSVVSNLAGKKTYYFAVAAYNSAGESCLSNEITTYVS